MHICIEVNRETCTRCGKCVRVCPAAIFTQEKTAGEVGLHRVESCIKCGHCVGVCPASSVEHSVFPPEKIHPVRTELLPSPEQVMMLIRSRRSNRAFSKKQVPGEMLGQIAEAAHRAPTASNMQQVNFTLVTDPVMLGKVIDFTIDIFAEQAGKLENPKYVKHMQEARAGGNDPILRNATALLLIHTPEESRFGSVDANLAYQNGSLMAESLGVSQVYTGFLCTALKKDKKRRMYELLNIKGTVHAGMALGMPAFTFGKYIDKKEIKITTI